MSLKPFRVVERGTGMLLASSTSKEGAKRLVIQKRRERDRAGLATNRIDVFELIFEEGDGPAL